MIFFIKASTTVDLWPLIISLLLVIRRCLTNIIICNKKEMLYVFHTYKKLMWSMPNIVFYIEIDYLSIDESKLLSSKENNAKTKGALCPWKQMHTLCGFILRPSAIDEHLLT